MSRSRRYMSRDSYMKFENGYRGYANAHWRPETRRWFARIVHKSNRRCAQQLLQAEVREFYAPDPFAWIDNMPETDLNFCDACNEYHDSSFWQEIDYDWDAEKHAPEFQYDDSYALEDLFPHV